MGGQRGKRRRAPERSAFGVLPTPWSLRMSDASAGGGCGGPGACGPEAACRAFPNGTFACLCPHDASRPTEDLRCPNRRTVPMTPQPIRSIIPPSAANLTSTRGSVEAAPSQKKGAMSYRDTAAWGGTAAALTVLLIAFVAIFWWRRRVGSRMTKGQSSAQPAPVSLSKGVLLADRYTSNPQYSPSLPVSVDPPVPIIPKESLVFLQEIGEGCFGKVYRGELKDMTHQKTSLEPSCPTHSFSQDFERALPGGETNSSVVAIKVLKDSASQEAEEDFLREVEIMSAFRHENILALIGVVIQENGQSPWMVFEFMPFGDLAEVLRSNSRELWKPVPGLPPLTKLSLLSVCIQIACGMKYLSAQRFVHRDLACRNCLVGAGLTVKIADFGMSRDIYTCDYYKIGGSRMLPVRWMSPECLMFGRFTLESDLWSYGVVLWEIFSLGKQPYYGHSNEEVVKLILQGIMLIPPEDCPPTVCNLMRACWKTEPKDRLCFADIHSHLIEAWEVMSSSSESASEGLGQSRNHSLNSTNSMDCTKTSISSSVPLPPLLPPTVIELLDPDNYLLPHHSRGNTPIDTVGADTCITFPSSSPPRPSFPEYLQPLPD